MSHLGTSAERNQIARWANACSAMLHVGFVLLGADGQLDDATPTACVLFGAADAEALRSRWSAIHDKLIPSLRDSVDTAQIVEMSIELEGQSRRVRCEVHALTEDHGVRHLLLVQASERTAAIENALHAASRYQTLAALSATTAHDVNGSLNAMMLNLELFSRTLEPGVSRPDDADVQRHCLHAIRQELGRLALSVGSVLDESRVEDAQPSRVCLTAILESVVSLLRAKAERQRVAIRLDGSDHAIEVIGHERDLRQAILNLAHNALEAMPEGGELALELSADGPIAVVTVADTGTGIRDDLRHKMWDLYFSTKSQGLGIGLHVVKAVVHAHGGSVVLDASDSGARFAIRLPLAR
ncbi:MAG: HAMP domain-containing sensor histidine kinase [Vicinamibacterales bacterium]